MQMPWILEILWHAWIMLDIVYCMYYLVDLSKLQSFQAWLPEAFV